MSVKTPLISELRENLVDQISSSLNESLPLLPKSFERVLSSVLAGVIIILYKYASFISLQHLTEYASAKEIEVFGKKIIPLVELGRQKRVGDPTPATKAELEIEVTVLNQEGVIRAGEQLTSNLNGLIYLTKTSTALNAPVVRLVVRAVSGPQGEDGSGVIGNLEADSEISFVRPVENINREAKVVSQVVTAANAEDMEVYRQRIKDHEQKPPQGGAYSDYEIWGEEAAGVLNVYPYKNAVRPTQVDVYVEATPQSSGSPDGIPTQAQLNSVKKIIDFDSEGIASRRPVGALVNPLPISRIEFSVIVKGIVSSHLAQDQDDIRKSLEKEFAEFEPFILGLSLLPRKDLITKAKIISVVSDVLSANGGYFEEVSLQLSSVDLKMYALNEGEKAKVVVGFV